MALKRSEIGLGRLVDRRSGASSWIEVRVGHNRASLWETGFAEQSSECAEVDAMDGNEGDPFTFQIKSEHLFYQRR